jgi:uncharacterized membrane protein YagU involved in acid resistance
MNRTIKDVIFGVVGGIAGTAVIGQVMNSLKKLQSEEDKKQERDLVPEDPTQKLARKLSEDLLGVRLSDETKSTAGEMVRWGYGAFWGGVYGILRRRVPTMATGAGLPFGVAFGFLGPAVMLPAMGLTPPATEFPISTHARALVSHYAYAATVEGVCELCDKIERMIGTQDRRTNPYLREAS